MTLKRFSQSATRPAALALLAVSLCAPSAWPLSRPGTGTSQTFALTSSALSSNVPAPKDGLANLGAFDQAAAIGSMRHGRPMPRSLENGGLPLLASEGNVNAELQQLLQAILAMEQKQEAVQIQEAQQIQAMQELVDQIMEMILNSWNG